MNKIQFAHGNNPPPGKRKGGTMRSICSREASKFPGNLRCVPSSAALSSAVKLELDRRYADYLTNPAEGSSWEDAKRRLAGS